MCHSLAWYSSCSGWRHHPGFHLLPDALPALLCPGDLTSVPGVGGEELRAAAGKSLPWHCSFLGPGFKETGRSEIPNEEAKSGG